MEIANNILDELECMVDTNLYGCRVSRSYPEQDGYFLELPYTEKPGLLVNKERLKSDEKLLRFLYNLILSKKFIEKCEYDPYDLVSLSNDYGSGGELFDCVDYDKLQVEASRLSDKINSDGNQD